MHSFTIQANAYLSQNILAFYHTDYTGYQNPGNPDYINALKNTYADASNALLQGAVHKLKSVLRDDLTQILQLLQHDLLTVCVVPRAKTHYQENQMLFKSTVRDVVNQLQSFCDGTEYIIRHTNTKTTHLRRDTPNYTNDGREPYPGITTATCNISDNIMDREILLIDDLYTKTVNIDEDAIQALLNNGARSVVFYAVGRTVEKE
jgi:predicted amidophosphoribosyltransferase